MPRTLSDLTSTSSPTFRIGPKATGATLDASALTAPRTHALPDNSGTLMTSADLSGLAPLASPALTGVPTAPTAAPDTSTTQIATTAFAKAEADVAQAAAIAASDPAGSAAAAQAAAIAAAASDATTKANAAQAAAVAASDPAGAAAAAQAAAITASCQRASNLSDLASAATARGNLGLGSAATQASSAFDAAGAAAAAQSAAASDATTKANAAQAAAIAASDPAGSAAAAQAAAIASSAQRASNLSDLASAATARNNLGLGTAATQASTAFDAAGAAAAAQAAAIAASDPAGSAATAQAAAIAASCQRASNLSDVASAVASRSNLGLGGAAVLNVGTTAGTVAAGDDSRLSDARTPTAHASTHASAGSDPVTLAQSQVANLTTDLAAKAADSAVVHLSGTETITGAKTFTATLSFSDVARGTKGDAATSTTTGDISVTGGISSAKSNWWGAIQTTDLGTGALPTGVGTHSREAAADAQVLRKEFYTWGNTNGTAFIVYNAGGTRAVPTATPGGNIIFNMNGRGYDGSAYLSKCAYNQQTDGAWSAGVNNGTFHQWVGCPLNSTSHTIWMELRNGRLELFQGGIKLPIGKKLEMVEGSNAALGTATLVAGTVTVSTTAVTATSRIFLTHQNASGTVGVPYISAKTAGTSFVITSSNAADTSTIAWCIVDGA